jgi:hypothetical protein
VSGATGELVERQPHQSQADRCDRTRRRSTASAPRYDAYQFRDPYRSVGEQMIVVIRRLAAPHQPRFVRSDSRIKASHSGLTVDPEHAGTIASS